MTLSLSTISKWYVVAIALIWIFGLASIFIEEPWTRSPKVALGLVTLNLLLTISYGGALYLVVLLPAWFLCSRIHAYWKKSR